MRSVARLAVVVTVWTYVRLSVPYLPSRATRRGAELRHENIIRCRVLLRDFFRKWHRLFIHGCFRFGRLYS